MYRPNFCAECGEKIVRLNWRAWTSRRFCDGCAKVLRKQRWKPKAITAIALIFIGFFAGRMGRPKPPPLVIERSATAPANTTKTPSVEEPFYICGARTKKGSPCSRRVHGPVRCWQHKGKPAMLPPDKLIIKE